MIAAVVTNGLGIADEPEIADHLDEVVVSLDAVTPEIHDRLRGAGTHARVVRAIDNALDRGVPTYVVMVVSTFNYDELEAMVEFCERRGLKMNAQPALFGRSYFDDTARSIGLEHDQIREMHTRLAEWKRRRRPLMFSAATYNRVVSWPDYDEVSTRSEGRSRCFAGRFYAHIDPNGDVTPCQQHDSDLVPRNVIRDGLEEALLHAAHHHCGDCYPTYLNERKALFGLRPSALIEVLRRG
jgi:MoaA/NifB/PqqE/SkfB family radical SAM enzyme